MALIKVIELLAESKKSWEDAAQNAVDEASKSVRNK
jgi:flavin-binding protein dodecin